MIKLKAWLAVSCTLLIVSVAVFGQGLDVRTATKTDRLDFGAGGTITITGAPDGTIRVTGSSKNEITITAEVSVSGASEAEFAELSRTIGFVTDESAMRVGIASVGSHNKFGLKKLPKKFPARLLGLPFRINYVIGVPRYSDLEIDGGKGDVSVTGVEGALRLNLVESNASVEVLGGETQVMIGTGTLDIGFGARGWRARSADIQVGKGDIKVALPANASAEIDGVILRSGSIENAIAELRPRGRKVVFTDKSVLGKIGVGGPSLKFTVGDGTLKLTRL
jgi:hypothetical protein